MKTSLSLAGAVLLLLSQAAMSAVLSLNPVHIIDFEDLEAGQPPSTVGWSNNANVIGVVPGGANTSTGAITTSSSAGTNAQSVNSPTITPSLTGDQLYFSMWYMRASGGQASGARVLARVGNTAFAGFGGVDSGNYGFMFYGDLDPSDGVTPGWIESSVNRV